MSGAPPAWPSRATVVREISRHRALVVGGLAAAAVAAGLPTLTPPGGPRTDVLVAAHDLAAGAALEPGDLLPAALPAALAPAGALRSAGGLVLAGPMRRGEVLTDVRVGAGGLTGGLAPGLVAVPVRVAEPGAAGLVQPGNRVDVLAAAAGPVAANLPGPATVVGSDLEVLAVPALPQAATAEGSLLVLAATPAAAARLAGAAAGAHLSLAIRAA